MTGFLLDTNVLSEFSRSASPPNPEVARWVQAAHPDALFISVLSFGEIRKGIDLLPAGKKRDDLERWIDSGLHEWFGSNLLPVTQAISDRWGRLAAHSQRQGRPLGNIDGLLAATAFEYGLTVATRNTRHFVDLDVTTFDPWENIR